MGGIPGREAKLRGAGGLAPPGRWHASKRKAFRQERQNVSKEKKREYIRYIVVLISWLVLVWLFFFVLTAHGTVISGSMEPTLQIGDICFYNRLSYVFGEPERGDIVLFEKQELTEGVIAKRIIGLPGETVSFAGGKVLINGTLIEETYLAKGTETNGFIAYEVPEDCYFLMGDNRENSYDSRYWENPYVSREEIQAKYVFTFWHKH